MDHAQKEIIKTKYNVNWFNFEQRIRQIVADIMNPVSQNQLQIKRMLTDQVFSRLDFLQSQADSVQKTISELQIKQADKDWNINDFVE